MTSYSSYVQGSTGPWEVVIGLEVHAQIDSKAKLFSGASTAFGALPNTQVSFVDAGFPGMLPVINEFCIRQAIKTGMGLNAEINRVSIFDRKNYFYADLPQGYQISQFKHPIVGKGYIDLEMEDGKTRRIGITRLHLEQDAGKSIHDQHPHKSYIDLNRAGIALMEIVSEPDIRNVEEAQAFMKKLRTLLRCLGTCDGNMEQGSLRADVNISLRRPGEPLGTRAEIKNVNSIRFMGQAIQFEIKRQMEILEKGGKIEQETRLFDPQKGQTRSMRNKENAHDYRYFPDPDLPPLILSEQEVQQIRTLLPELPDARKKRFIENFSLPAYDAEVLTSETEIANFYEECLSFGNEGYDAQKFAKTCANWIIGEVFAALNRESLSFEHSRITAAYLAELVKLLLDGAISGRSAKEIFSEMWDTGDSPTAIVKRKGLEQISDNKLIEEAVDHILSLNSEKVAEYRSGKDKLFAFFVGLVMKELKGKANPGVVNEILKKKLEQA
jgi:aspartyl-tRNA(Asn)/glutamyl-tRNA(Gln) amidotransferase subunit B